MKLDIVKVFSDSMNGKLPSKDIDKICKKLLLMTMKFFLRQHIYPDSGPLFYGGFKT
ncbi:hypothetical protein XBP1_720014 [Xenorhabdus bovienii str. puntauvense]|uniref:Uncharacterized protein n=1 Tax=Xenorhabdus bovienii str. puntauvense TaxID=1398201 RepID=A0A077NKF7_XENBV|nr:hypothetical protein XBP1_720014 [Xenorhabdus bovienii str. puntauvense]